MAGRGRWGFPTVADRVAQMVVKRYLEPLVEPVFHKDSYGYRPGTSALDAVGVARQRCWRHGWVLDLDIKAFFDSIDWSLLMRGNCSPHLARGSTCEVRRARSEGRRVPRRGLPLRC